MERKRLLLIITALLILVLSALPGTAVGQPADASSPAKTGLAEKNSLPFDPQEVMRQVRNHFTAEPTGLSNNNGYRQVTANDWGLSFVPYVGGMLRPEYQVDLRLAEIRAGEVVLYSAPTRGGDAPTLRNNTTVAYARPGNISEEYRSLDFAVEQVFVLPEPLAQQGDLVFSTLASTALAPVQRENRVVFPIDSAVELFYGHALVRDAAGRELGLVLRLRGNLLELVVPGDWLAAATYPVEVDPLIGTTLTVSTTSTDQKLPKVAGTPSGDHYLVVWEDARNMITNNLDVYAQRLNGDGTLNGGVINIKGATPSGIQKAPDVVFDSINNVYMVVYQDDQGGTYDIKGRTVNPGNGNLGTENTFANGSNNQTRPAIAVNPGSTGYRYFVAYNDDGDSPGDVRGALVSSSGVPGTPFNIAAVSGRAEVNPDVDYGSSNSRWLVVWQESGTDLNIYGRQFDADGSNPGGTINVSTATSDQEFPAIAYNSSPDNQYLVVWEDYRGSMITGWDVYGQRVNGDGTLDTQGNFAIFNQGAPDRYPAVAYATGSNEYVVASQQGNYTIGVQQVSNSGQIMAATYAIAAGTWDKREYPAVACNGSRNQHLVVWQELLALGTAGYDIAGQRLDTSYIVASTGSNERYSGVAYNSTGDEYLISWSKTVSGVDYIYAQRVSSTGSLNGSAIAVCDNLSGCSTGSRPWTSVAYDDNYNRYLVVWEDGGDIYGREVQADGTPYQTRFSISTATNAQQRPQASYDATGNQYLVVWEDYQNNTYDIYGARVVPQSGGQAQVYALASAIASGANTDRYPSVAANPNAVDPTPGASYRFLVVWDRDNTSEIYGRFVGYDGTQSYSEFYILRSTEGSYHVPSVAYGTLSQKYLVTANRHDVNWFYWPYARLVSDTGTLPGSPILLWNEYTGTSPIVSAHGGHFHTFWVLYLGGVHTARVDGSTGSVSEQSTLFGKDPSLFGELMSTCDSSGTRCLVSRTMQPSGYDIYAGFLFR